MRSASIGRLVVAVDVGDPSGELTLAGAYATAKDGELALRLSLLAHHLWVVWLPSAGRGDGYNPA